MGLDVRGGGLAASGQVEEWFFTTRREGRGRKEKISSGRRRWKSTFFAILQAKIHFFAAVHKGIIPQEVVFRLSGGGVSSPRPRMPMGLYVGG